MNRRNTTIALGALSLLAAGGLAGCGVGNDRALFATTVNAGLNVETRPPTAELSVGTRELAITPTFEGGQTPPLMGSFGYKNGKENEALSIASHNNFAGGDAALVMAGLLNDPMPNSLKPDLSKTPTPVADSTLCVSAPSTPTAPEGRSGQAMDLPGPGEVTPLIVGTNTTFGLTVGWSGLTAVMPDTLRFGFNRKQMALAPVTTTPGCPSTAMQPPGGVKPDTIGVRLPAFLATFDGETKAGGPGATGATISQFFATGASATMLALRQDVRAPFINRMVPKAEGCTYGPSASGMTIKSWLGSPIDATKAETFANWVKGVDPKADPTETLNCQEYDAVRKNFISAQGLPT